MLLLDLLGGEFKQYRTAWRRGGHLEPGHQAGHHPAALELWSERGYAEDADDPTAEEIADRASISKATFYLHFARKDDILLATAWVTTKVFYEDALEALLRGGPVDEVIDDVTVRLCRRIEKVPRPVQRRMLRAQPTSAGSQRPPENADHFGFDRGFALIFQHAQQAGDLPRTVTAGALGGMFEAMLYASLREWAHDDDADLLAMLRVRFAVLLAGARGVTPEALARATLLPASGRVAAVTRSLTPYSDPIPNGPAHSFTERTRETRSPSC